MLKYLAIVLALLAVPASAKDITIQLNDNEQAALLNLLDIAVKSGGIQTAGAVVYFQNKIGVAVQTANNPPMPTPEQQKINPQPVPK